MELLVGQKAICGYLKRSKPTYLKYLKMGMPVIYINGRVEAFKEEIEKWKIKGNNKNKT
jgi:hypothetical protein